MKSVPMITALECSFFIFEVKETVNQRTVTENIGNPLIIKLNKSNTREVLPVRIILSNSSSN